MSYSVMFALLLLTPLLFSLLCFACRKRRLSATRTVTVLHSLGITLLLILAGGVLLVVLDRNFSLLVLLAALALALCPAKKRK